MASYILKRSSDSRVYVGINPKTFAPMFRRPSEFKKYQTAVRFASGSQAHDAREELTRFNYGYYLDYEIVRETKFRTY